MNSRSDIVQYKCFICDHSSAERYELVKHVRAHLHQVFQCVYCVTKAVDLKEIWKHHEHVHNSKSTDFRITNARDNLHSYYQIIVLFANGLQMILGDLIHTKYADVERLVEFVNELNGFEKHSQLSGYGATLQTRVAKKIGDRRRQTLL